MVADFASRIPGSLSLQSLTDRKQLCADHDLQQSSQLKQTSPSTQHSTAMCSETSKHIMTLSVLVLACSSHPAGNWNKRSFGFSSTVVVVDPSWSLNFPLPKPATIMPCLMNISWSEPFCTNAEPPPLMIRVTFACLMLTIGVSSNTFTSQVRSWWSTFTSRLPVGPFSQGCRKSSRIVVNISYNTLPPTPRPESMLPKMLANSLRQIKKAPQRMKKLITHLHTLTEKTNIMITWLEFLSLSNLRTEANVSLHLLVVYKNLESTIKRLM